MKPRKFSDADLAVWWLTQKDYLGFEPHQEQNPLCIPDYAWLEFLDRCGRPGRFRLWVPQHIALECLPVLENDPRWDSLKNEVGGDAGGIVIERKDAELCSRWGGKLTTLDLAPLAVGKDSKTYRKTRAAR